MTYLTVPGWNVFDWQTQILYITAAIYYTKLSYYYNFLIVRDQHTTYYMYKEWIKISHKQLILIFIGWGAFCPCPCKKKLVGATRGICVREGVSYLKKPSLLRFRN